MSPLKCILEGGVQIIGEAGSRGAFVSHSPGETPSGVVLSVV